MKYLLHSRSVLSSSARRSQLDFKEPSEQSSIELHNYAHGLLDLGSFSGIISQAN